MREIPARDEPFFSFVLVGMRRPPLWTHPAWAEALPAFDTLLELTGVPAAVRSMQLDRVKPPQQSRFGRLTWSSESHARWVLSSSPSDVDRATRTFLSTEIWAPSWGACEKQDGAPFFFAAIDNPHGVAHASPGQFNQLIHIAVLRVFALAHSGAVTESLMRIARVVQSRVTVFRVAPWWDRMDSVQDALTNHFSYAGRGNDAVPDLSKMRTAWQPFDGTLHFPTERPNER